MKLPAYVRGKLSSIPKLTLFLGCPVLLLVHLSRSFRNSTTSGVIFQSDAHPINNAQEQMLPRWWNGEENGPPSRQSHMSNMLDFAHGLLAGNATTIERPKTRSRWPETLYVIDRKGVWVSKTIRDRCWKLGLSRVLSVENMLHHAWNFFLLRDHEGERVNSNRWPMLNQALTIRENEGLPFFLWYGDYTSCNLRNWMVAGTMTKRTIPLLTASAPINCTHAFPFPNYGTLDIARKDSASWDTLFREQSAAYPWGTKFRQVVWRGSLSAPNDDLQSVRWRLCRLASKLSENDDRQLLDVGLVEIPRRHDHLHLNVSLVGGLKEPIRPMKRFQQYVAVLDVDGNSWSSRFATLICSNSVVLKVEPAHVEYYYSELHPWKHYVPIRLDLSDLMDQARFVLDGRNEASVRAIIKNANDWCRTRLTHNASATAMLDILERYAASLSRDAPNTNWMEQWREAKPGMFSDANFQMMILPPKSEGFS